MRAKIGLLLIVVAAGLLFTACASNGTVHQADPATKELVIKAWAEDGGSTILIVATVDGEFSETASFFTWYYDVPANQVEYLVKIEPGRYVILHLHQDKAPQK